MRLFIDGMLGASATGPTGDLSYNNGRATSFPDSDPFLVLGAEKHDAGSAYPSFAGWLDELRISSTVRYAANFTPPAQPHFPDAQTAALYHFDEATAERINDSAGHALGPNTGVRRVGGNPVGPMWSHETPFADRALLFGVQGNGQAQDFARQNAIPAGFGAGEFTLELWIKPDAGFPVGPTASGAAQRVNWSDADVAPYSASEWWAAGNFLLDGRNAAALAHGTFALQFHGGGRVRWLVGDGSSVGPGGVRSVGTFPAGNTPSLLDGRWHHLACVRRFTGASGATLELWIDSALVAAAATPVRTDLRGWWETWTSFPAGQEGWIWGAQKPAALGLAPQHEDYKGLLDEVRFWNRALTPAELSEAQRWGVNGREDGLAGAFRFGEGSGSLAQDAISGATVSLSHMLPAHWFPAAPNILPAEARPLHLQKVGIGALHARGAMGQPFLIERSDDLSSWQLLQSGVFQRSVEIFGDPAAAALPRRFYRARIP
jgi:hypothetical protein